jgi:hypothetical protein
MIYNHHLLYTMQAVHVKFIKYSRGNNKKLFHRPSDPQSRKSLVKGERFVRFEWRSDEASFSLIFFFLYQDTRDIQPIKSFGSFHSSKSQTLKCVVFMLTSWRDDKAGHPWVIEYIPQLNSNQLNFELL